MNLELRISSVNDRDRHLGDDGGEESGFDGHRHRVEKVSAAL
jgi:hypothetical protein